REWADRCDHPVSGAYHDDIHRSLLILKALTYAPTGGIVAAPTTSLPEKLGGVRNWDYRFTWLRDASVTLLAMLEAGYTEEVDRWREVRDRIHAEVCAKAWNDEVGAFTQFYGAKRLDAAVLLMPLVGFIEPNDERMISTVEAIQRGLDVGGLIARYAADDENV